jgi:hypothetical protein
MGHRPAPRSVRRRPVVKTPADTYAPPLTSQNWGMYQTRSAPQARWTAWRASSPPLSTIQFAAVCCLDTAAGGHVADYLRALTAASSTDDWRRDYATEPVRLSITARSNGSEWIVPLEVPVTIESAS